MVPLKQTIIIFRNKLLAFILAITFFKVADCAAQLPHLIFKHITIGNGLLNNNITALCKDKDGFIWIGTQLGLQRYDGIRFKNYIANSRDTLALHCDAITYIFEDKKKRLWIGTNDGAYLLNSRTGNFYNYNLYASAANTIRAIWKITEDSSGAIWVAGHDGYFKLDDRTNQFVSYNAKLGIKPGEKTGALTFDAENNLWIHMGTGLKFYNSSEHKVYDKFYNPNHNPLLDIQGSISNMISNKKEIWLSALYDKIIYKYDILTQKIKMFSFAKLTGNNQNPEIKNEYTGTIFRLSNDQIVAILPGRGLAFYNPVLDNFEIIDADDGKDYAYHGSEKSENPGFFVLDDAQNILIGNCSGINIYSPSSLKFITHAHTDVPYHLFPKAACSDFLELPNGDVLFSYYYLNGGIVKTDKNFNFQRHFVVKNEVEKNPINQIWNLFLDRDGIVWAPNQGHSILKYNTTTQKIVEEKDTSLSGPINDIKQDEAGIIWAGHWNKGLVKIDKVAGTKDYFTEFKSTDITAPKRIFKILSDGNKIWACTLQNGLQVFDKAMERFTESYEINERSKDAISSNTVKDILKYNKDTLVLATFMGINIFDIHSKKFTAITVKEGLASNLTLGIMKDVQGNIWVTCANGHLCKINMHNLFITSYDKNDGITDNSFDSRIAILKNGMALIAGANSFISFNPASILALKPPANVLITGCKVFEQEIVIDSLIANNLPLNLTYKENSLRLEFVSLDFWKPEGIKYFYRLKGIDKDWVQSDKTNIAIYNQLEYGKYVFEIKCANRDGINCKAVTAFSFNITPPFYKTWWFISLILFCSLLWIRQIIKWREKKIKAIEDGKLKLEQLNANQLKNKLELEQIINYFSFSLIKKNTVDDVLWDVAKNLIARLGFTECMMYSWNSDKSKMEQRAGYGPKGTKEEIQNNQFQVLPGQGIVGYVIQTKEAVLIPDTSKDSRYRIGDLKSLSEIAVPVIYNDELIGVIDSEHPQKDFFTRQHLEILTTIAALMANKIKAIESAESLQHAKIEMLSINEKLSEAKLEALRSQMNPHFIFNSLNAIQECILTNKVDAAYEYLSKFSKLQRLVLNNSAKEFIPLSSELEMLKLYLSLEFLRFNESFSYTIKIVEHTDEDEINVPSMLIQPYVENAVWHGLRTKTGNKILIITCEENLGQLIVTIDDNGIGRKNAAILKAKLIGNTEAKGTALAAERLSILALKYKAVINIETIDKVNNNNEPIGTTIIITVPVDIETINP